MVRMMRILAFEIGGSTTRAAIADAASQRLLAERRAATPNFHTHGHDGARGVLDSLCVTLSRLGEALCKGQTADAVAVGYAGPVSPEGVALSSPTILGANLNQPFDVAEIVRRATGLERVLVMNDVTACGFRYIAAGESDFMLVNIGSGVGNKLFLNGCPVVGPGGRGGEIGHFTMDMRRGAPLCECGGRGHLAGISSGRGVEKAIRAAARRDSAAYQASALARACQGREPTATDIAPAYAAGDKWTQARIFETTRPLANALAGVHAAIGIERFIIVGGFALALGPQWIKLLASQCATATWDLGQEWEHMIRLGQAGDRDGLVGLAYAGSRMLGAQEK